MAFAPGIITENILAANQLVASSITPVNVTGFTFNLNAGKKLIWEVNGIFSTGVAGGFRFLAHSATAPATYNATFQAVDETTPATFQDVQGTEAAFTDASAVEANYLLTASGVIIANLATVFSFQFAQNNSNAAPIALVAGFRIRLTQL